MIATLALPIWLYLFFLHGKFWESTPELPPATPPEFPDVDIVIPARDEAGTIAPVIASLLAQDYAGNFRVILVDDNSTDGTAQLAGTHLKLTIVTGKPKAPGWSGKLWALQQGVEASTAPILLFADADITHDSRHLSSLVTRLLTPRADMVSEMVRLNCTSLPERFLIPAFVYFFQMLYPFALVNNPLKSTAAAGGTVLIRREALDRLGGQRARAVGPFGPLRHRCGVHDDVSQHRDVLDRCHVDPQREHDVDDLFQVVLVLERDQVGERRGRTLHQRDAHLGDDAQV